ncbi:MAG: tRNA(Ile)(2)-agmatinylcytidine synthase [Candidatus Altiarchaeota archaeon]
MLVGIDDTDSLEGGCTTYVAALLSKKLELRGLPRLIRLNPAIPFKTRGNGAVAFEVDGGYDPQEVKGIVEEFVRSNSFTDDENTNPGVVFIEYGGSDLRESLFAFYRRAVSELVSIRDAEELISRFSLDHFRLGNGRGLIGALAAIGAPLHRRTYELISYRLPENRGLPRSIEEDSVWAMDEVLFPRTFDNVDRKSKRVLILPRGKDPIYAGIRGVSKEAVEEAWRMIRPTEQVERIAVFLTNQGSDDHITAKKIFEVKSFDCVALSGEVERKPEVIEGGHVFFGLSDGSGSIDCAAYEPTGEFRSEVSKLQVGDRITVTGCIGKYPGTVNLEKFRVNGLVEQKIIDAPYCCNGKKMTSAGRVQGFKCRHCSNSITLESAPTKIIPRELVTGWYEVPPKARRHLARPLALESH